MDNEAADRERLLALLVRLEPFLVRLDDLVRRSGPDRVMGALDRLDKWLNPKNPAAMFRGRSKGG